MLYLYCIILGCYLLLFVLSRKMEVSEYLNQTKEQSFPGKKLFAKAVVWCMNLKKRQTTLNRKGKQQMQEFYIRQYSLVLLILFVGTLLSLCVALSEQMNGHLQEGAYVNRKPYGEGEVKLTLSAQIEGEESEEISYIVEEQKYTEEEIHRLYQEASAHLTELVLGENSSLDNVTSDLNLVTSIEGYPFRISWSSSSYSIVHTDGSVNNEDLEESEIVTLTSHFQYENTAYEQVFPVQIQPAVYTEEELLVKRIEASLEEQNQLSRSESIMKLPEQIEDKVVVWKEVIQDSSSYFFLLICAATVLIFLSGSKEAERDLERRKKEMLLDYPEIVNKLTLYMGAGMTIRNAFFKMGEDYKKQKVSDRKRCIYEEILLLCHELQSGISETEAYTHLGKRCHLQVYMKLCTLLSQNLRKGSNDLLKTLRQEAENAFEERKNTAKKLGEEAGTKLLLPMMMMLCIVMALIMIPAFLSFS